MAWPSHCYWTLLVLSIIICKSNSGVISDLPEDEVEQVLALYHRSCGGGGGYGGGYGPSSSEPNVNIVCKEPREYTSPQDKKVIKIPAQMSAYKKQVIFVEVPATHFKHEITLVPGPDDGKPTKIYVLPQKSSHDIRVEDQRYGAGGVSKPEVFFLKGGNNIDSGGSGGYPEYNPPSGYGTGTQAPAEVSYGVSPAQPPPSQSGSYGPPSQGYGPPQQESSSYGPPLQQLVSSTYGPPPTRPPQSNYGGPPPPPGPPPQSNYGGPPPPGPPQSNYGGPPPPGPPPQSNYGAPVSPEPPSQSNYGASVSPATSSPPQPPQSNYGPPQSTSQPQETTYTVPSGYEVKQTYEVQNNKLTYSTLPPQLRTYTQLTNAPLPLQPDTSLSSLLRKLSDRLRTNSRRHARYHSTFNSLITSITSPADNPPKPNERPRFIFPSESRVVPVKAILGTSTRIASRPNTNKFSSKFNNNNTTTLPELIAITQEDAVTTPETPKYGSRIVLPTPSSSPSHDEDIVEEQSYSNKDSEDSSSIFEYVPATYLGYTYVVDGQTINSTSAPAPQQQQLEQYSNS